MTTQREPDRGPQRIGTSLDRLLGTLRAPTVDVLDAVFRRWDEIVGPDVARHSRPVAVAGDQLTVSAVDPTWASELRWLEREVLARCAEVAGTERISRLVVRVDRHK